MKNHLENFVRQNREAFDDKQPGYSVWERIEASLWGRASRWGRPVVLWRAAAIFFMLLSGYLLLPDRLTARTENARALKEFSDVEAFYFQQISNKVDLIHEFRRTEGLNGFTEDFRQLEAMYLVLKEEMKNRPTQEVRDALVLNLLVRIDLLNQHIQRLEDARKSPADQKVSEKKV